jgi:exopolysaccharide production protein ExoY
MEPGEAAPVMPPDALSKDAVLRDLLCGNQNGSAQADRVIDLRSDQIEPDEHRIVDLGNDGVVQLRDDQTANLHHQPSRLPANAYAMWGKRVLDVVLVLLWLPFWGLLYVVIALALFLAQGRPIHYRSTRVGRGGREFRVWKFRTMKLHADSELALLLTTNPALAQEFKDAVKLRLDPRVTRLGRFLRCASLDELPQLLNVICGQMSLVGPRPVLRVEMDELYGVHAAEIMRFRPGLTGLWQVSGRSLTSYEERVALDLRYTQECSLLVDLAIQLKTVPCVLRGYGAF